MCYQTQSFYGSFVLTISLLCWGPLQGCSTEITSDVPNRPALAKDTIHRAASRGDCFRVWEFLQLDKHSRTKNNLHQVGVLGNTPLHSAILSNHLNVARILLANNARVDISNIYGNTPLHAAAFGASYDMIKLLLNCKASPAQLNFADEMPLRSALKMNRTEDIITLLTSVTPCASSNTP